MTKRAALGLADLGYLEITNGHSKHKVDRMTTDEKLDRYAWAIETARRLRAGEPVDTAAVAEELEQIGRSDARELDIRISQILEHLLKLRLARGAILESNSRVWQASIAAGAERSWACSKRAPA